MRWLVVLTGLVALSSPVAAAEVRILISSTGGQEGDTLAKLVVADQKIPAKPDAALALSLATKALQAGELQSGQTAANVVWWLFEQTPYLAKVRLERKDGHWEDGEVSFSNGLSGQRSFWRGDRNGFTTRQDWDDYNNQTVEERLDPQSGAVMSHSNFIYQSGQLVERVELDENSKELLKETYQYDTRGLLRSISRTEPSGRVQSSSYVYENGRLSELILEDGLAREFRIFDDHGRVATEEQYTSDKLHGLSWFRYGADDSQKPLEKTWIETATKLVYRESYTDAGLLATLKRYSNEQNDLSIWQALNEADRGTAIDALHLQYLVSYEYDSDDKTIARSEWTEGAQERWEFERSGDSIKQERYLKNGNLVQTIVYDGDQAITTAYRDGKAVTRLFERNGQKFKTQELSGDKVLRERMYE